MAFGRAMRSGRWLAVLSLAGLLSWGGWYVYDKGFGRRWRTALTKEFERFGLAVNARRLTLDPFHGLVARDVQILGGAGQQNVLAEISEISLDINYANLLSHEQALNAVDLRDARISIPLDQNDPKSGTLAIKNLHARVYFFPGRIDFRQVTGDLYGIQFTTSGTLVNPGRLQPELGVQQVISDAGYRAAQRFATRVLDELHRTQFTGETPQLGFTFQADLGDLASLRIQNGHLTAPTLSRSGYHLRNLEAEFALANRRADLIRLQVRDDDGELSAKADWDFVAGQRAFQVRSTLDLARLLATEPRCGWTRDLTFEAPPEVELAGATTTAGRLQYFGRLNFDRFTFRTVAFQSLKAEFSRAGESWMIHDAEATHATGTLSGDALRLPGEFRLRVTSAVNPAALAPIFPVPVQRALANWQFQSAPVIQASFSAHRPTFDELDGGGTIFLGRTRFRQRNLNSASTAFTLKDSIIECRDVRVSRDEGIGTGSFRYNFRDGEVTLTDVQTSLDLDALIQWVSPSLIQAIQPLTWTKPPLLRANGTTHFSSSKRNHLAIEVTFPAAFTYSFGGVDFHFDGAKMHLLLLPGSLDLTGFSGQIGNGTVSLQSSTGLPLSRNTFRADLQLAEVPLVRALPNVDFLARSNGKLSGSLQLRRRGSEFSVPHFAGSLALSPAKLADFRLFSPVLGRLEGLGFSGPGVGSLQFHTERATVQIDALRLTQGLHLLEMTGYVSLLDGDVNVRGQIDGGKVRLRASGPLDRLTWELPAEGVD